MFDRPFSPETLNQSGNATLHHALEEKRKEVQGVTIDGATSKDFDDAIWVEPKTDGGYTVSVSIADVSSLVPKDSAMDKDAMQRATSLYRLHGVSPMLPGILSDNLLSLREGEMRPTVTATIDLDRNLEVTDIQLEKTKLASQKRYTYEQATRQMSDNHNPMHEWGRLAQGLMEKRRRQGALAFYDARSGIYVSGDNAAQQLQKQTAPAHILVQELMILANSAVAGKMAEAGMPYPFRNHRASSTMEGGAEIEHTLEELARRGELDMTKALRLAHLYKRATYDSSSQGHVGLRLPYYTHFTSPIRRYPDLIGHRIIKAFIEGKPSPYSKADLDGILPGVTERINAERDTKAETLKQHRLDRATRQSLHASTEQLLSLPKGDFSTLVRVAAESGEIGKEAANGIARRIREKQASLADMAHIMTIAPQDDGVWDWLRQEVLAYLKKNPPDAISLLMVCGNMHQDKWTYELRSQPIGDDAFASYVVAMIDGEPFSNTEAIRGSGRQVKQQAATDFWEQYATGTLVSPHETRMPEAQPVRSAVEQPKEKPAKPVFPQVSPEAADARWKAWQKLAGKHGYEEKWDYESYGDQDSLSWRAILTITGKDVSAQVKIPGEGQNKPAARLDAVRKATDDTRLPHKIGQESAESIVTTGNTGGGDTVKDPLYQFKELARRRRWQIGWEYQKEGPSHAPQWTAILTVNGSEDSFTGTSPDKKQAERDAAALALQSGIAYPETLSVIDIGKPLPASFVHREQKRNRQRRAEEKTGRGERFS